MNFPFHTLPSPQKTILPKMITTLPTRLIEPVTSKIADDPVVAVFKHSNSLCKKKLKVITQTYPIHRKRCLYSSMPLSHQICMFLKTLRAGRCARSITL